MQTNDDYRQHNPQIGHPHYVSQSFHHASHMLINPQNQSHDIGLSKSISAASSAMYAQNSGPMAGAASQHHQMGASPATSMVQPQQINSRMISTIRSRSVPNTMQSIPRNSMGDVVSPGPQPSHFPQMQMMQSHAVHHNAMATQPVIFQALGSSLYQQRSVAPPQYAQQQFSQVYLPPPQCYNFSATPNSASTPVQPEVGKRKKNIISIVDPHTMQQVQLPEEKSETSIMTDDQKSSLDTSATTTPSQSPAGLAQQDTTPVSVQAVSSAIKDKTEPEDGRSSTPSSQRKSLEITVVVPSCNNTDSSGSANSTDKLLPDSSDSLDEDKIVIGRNRDENKNIKTAVIAENVKIEDADKEDKMEKIRMESVLQQKTTKAILKLTYKEGQWSPSNPHGKKRYDRDFLLQLQVQPMSLKKPTNLPNLSIIRNKAQIHKVTDSVVRAPMPPPPMQTRNFADHILPNFARSGTQRLPPHRNINRSSHPRKDFRKKKVISFDSILTESVKLHEADNAWRCSLRNLSHYSEEGENTRTQELYNKFRGILNKLTLQKFDTLVKQVKDLDINNEERLKGVIDLVFERAIDKPNFPYANMCKQLAMVKVPLTEGEGCVNFKTLLVTKCLREFEPDKSEELNRVEKKKLIDNCKTEDKKRLQEEYLEEETKYRKRKLSNIHFIGELFKLGMLIEPIMHECVKKLLSQGDGISLECLCRLLTTIGKDLVTKKDRESNGYDTKKDTMNSYMNEMQRIVDKRQTSSRIRFMLEDVIDLIKRNWVSRRDQREAQEQQQLLQNMSFPKIMPDERPKISSTEPYPGRDSDHGGSGRNTVSKSNKPNISVGTIGLELESSKWGQGIGGGEALPPAENKPSAAPVNRFDIELKFMGKYYALDTSKIREYLNKIIEPMTDRAMTNLNYLKDLLQPCIPSRSAGRLVSSILHCAAEKRGEIKVGEMWRESGLQWKDFLPNDSDISSFIAYNKLDFTITPGKSQSSNKLSSPEIKKKIIFMLNSNHSNEYLFNWIESNIEDEKMHKSTFFRVLVTCLFEYIISGKSYDVDRTKVKQRFPLISLYVDGRDDLQLQTLYAAQSVATKLNQPKGLLEQLFEHLYHEDVISEESFKKWKESEDPAEQEGKDLAVASVTFFFFNLSGRTRNLKRR